MTDPSDPPGAADPAGFEAPASSRGRRAGAIAVVLAILAVGVAIVAAGELPDGAGEIDVDTSEADPGSGEDPVPGGAAEPRPTAEPEPEPEAATEPGPDADPTPEAVGDGAGNDDARTAGPRRSDDVASLAEADGPPGTLVVTGTSGIATVDLGSGAVRERPLERSRGFSSRGVEIIGDVIVEARAEGVRLSPLALDADSTLLDAGAPQVLPDPGGRAWVGGDVDDGSPPRRVWRPLDPVSGQIGDPVAVPAQAEVRGTTEDGLALWRAAQAFTIDTAGEVSALPGEGELLHAGPGGQLWRECSDELVCRLSVREDRTVRGELPALEEFGGWSIDDRQPSRLSADGGHAVVLARGARAYGVAAVDVDGGRSFLYEPDALGAPPVISSDGAWVAMLSASPVVWAPETGLTVELAVDIGHPTGVALR